MPCQRSAVSPKIPGLSIVDPIYVISEKTTNIILEDALKVFLFMTGLPKGVEDLIPLVLRGKRSLAKFRGCVAKRSGFGGR